METGSQTLTTYYAKRIIGDTAAADRATALLQTGANIATSTWILDRTNRANTYGIKYLFDTEGTADKIEFYGGHQANSVDAPTAWVQLDTGDAYFLGSVGIGHAPDTYKLYVNGTSYFTNTITIDNGCVNGEVIRIIGAANKVFSFKLSGDNTAGSNVDIGWNWTNAEGAGAAFRSTSFPSQEGEFRIYARKRNSSDVAVYTQLIGTPGDTIDGGNLSWGGSASIGASSSEGYKLYVNGTGYFTGILTVGTRVTSTAPSALTNVDRIIITPYYHSGGPWKITSRDDASNAYLSLFYNTSELIRTQHTGRTLIQAACDQSNSILSLNTTTNATWSRCLTIYGTALTQGNSLLFTIGKANSAKNMAYLGYYHDADGGGANRLTLGLHSVDNVINITGWGYIAVGDTVQMGNNTSWAKGTMIVGANGGDKVVIGYENGTVKGAVVGSHASTCTAWAALNISGSSINFRMSDTLVAKILDGCLSLFPTSNNYREGLRIHSYSSWSDITLCGNDNTEDSGITANSWFIGNNNGNFYIARNGSPGSTAYLSCVSNAWTFLNKVRIASTEDVNLGANGAFIIGATNSTNIGIDDNEIMARNNSAASTLYLNSEGGQVYIGSGGIYSGGDVALASGKRVHASGGALYLGNSNNANWVYVQDIASHSGTDKWKITVAGAATFAGGVTANVTGNCSGSSGSCTGNAASATAVKDKTNTGTLTYLNYGAAGLGYDSYTWLAGWNGYELRAIAKTQFARASHDHSSISGNAATASKLTNITSSDAASSSATQRYVWFSYNDNATGRPAYSTAFTFQSSTGTLTATKVKNAVWNDYAECREVETEEPGYCVTETSNGIMIKTSQRLQAGCKITSDTYGTCMGETETAKTPIAVAGRVLAYPYKNREEYELGAAVCSAPNGTVDIMSRDEIMMYPERIVGTVSEIPDYEIWHGGSKEQPKDIKVNDRIWIYVR